LGVVGVVGVGLLVWVGGPRIPRLVQSLQWHRHRNNDPAIRWLRDLFVDVARDV
jgi:DNA-binding transcriptional LysR family regulator